MDETLHHPTLRLNLLLFAFFLVAAVVLGSTLPDRYPVHFDLAGEPTRWEERGIGMYILLVSIGIITFGQGFLFQRFLVRGSNVHLLNIPHKERFLELPEARRLPVMRRMNRILGLTNTGVLLVFVAILFMKWWSAHQPGGWQAQASSWLLWAALAIVLIVPIAEAVGISRMIRRKLQEEGRLAS